MLNLRRLASPFAALVLLLSVPLLTGANGSGCGGDVNVGGDGGGGSTSTGNECSAHSDCEISDASCLLCNDGTCAPTACIEGTCQKACPTQGACSADSDCAVMPDICLVCADGTCGVAACVNGACGFQCDAPPGGECTVPADCPNGSSVRWRVPPWRTLWRAVRRR